MGALTERLIAARDRLRPLRSQGEESIRNPAVEATEVMADAANAIEELTAELDRITHYAENALAQFATGRGYLDISAFHSLTKDARAVIARQANRVTG